MDDPPASLPRRSLESHISQASLYRIVHEDLHLYAYRVQLTQELKERDHSERRYFFFFFKLDVRTEGFPESWNPEVSHQIIFGDEADFTLNEHVNKQNCRVCVEENPRITHNRSTLRTKM